MMCVPWLRRRIGSRRSQVQVSRTGWKAPLTSYVCVYPYHPSFEADPSARDSTPMLSPCIHIRHPINPVVTDDVHPELQGPPSAKFSKTSYVVCPTTQSASNFSASTYTGLETPRQSPITGCAHDRQLWHHPFHSEGPWNLESSHKIQGWHHSWPVGNNTQSCAVTSFGFSFVNPDQL